MVGGVVLRNARGKRGAKDHQKDEQRDCFNLLPLEVLCLIISMLPVGDAVRSSILSRRWRNIWKQVPNLDLDAKYMLCPLMRITTSSENHLDYILNQNKEKGIYRYAILLFLILRKHFGKLTTCRLKHFHTEDIGTWVMYLVEKKSDLKNLTLECIPISGSTQKQALPIDEFSNAHVYKVIFSSLESLDLIKYYITSSLVFQNSKKLRILTLKDVYIDEDETLTEILESCVSLEKFFLIHSFGLSTIKFKNPNLKFLEINLLTVDRIEISAEKLEDLMLAYLSCPVNKIVIEAPNIKDFFCRGNRRNPTPPKATRTSRLLQFCCGDSASERGQIFKNLSSVSIDCDLNNTMEALALSNMLKTSVDLVNLKIVIPPAFKQNFGGGRTTGNSTGALQEFSGSSFWEGREICNCVQNKLKYVYVEGFMGMNEEIDFVKYLILRSTKLQSLTLIGMGSTKVANVLFSLKSASPTLSIILKATRFQIN